MEINNIYIGIVKELIDKIYECSIVNEDKKNIFLNDKDIQIKVSLNDYVEIKCIKYDESLKKYFGEVLSNYGNSKSVINGIMASLRYENIDKNNNEEEFKESFQYYEKCIIDQARRDNLIVNDKYIYTMDCEGTNIRDDAFSITKINERDYDLSIYITNIPYIINVLEKWKVMNTNKPRSMYIFFKCGDKIGDKIGDKEEKGGANILMLPTTLSKLGSLDKGKERVAIAFNITIRSNIINDIKMESCIIKVKESFEREIDFRNNVISRTMSSLIYGLKRYKDLKSSVVEIPEFGKNNGGEMIKFFMLLINNYAFSIMKKNKIGIFYSYEEIKTENMIDERSINSSSSKNVKNFIKVWNTDKKKMVLYNDKENIDFIQITSPMRKLINLINFTILLKTEFLLTPKKDFDSYIKELLSNENVKNIDNKMKLFRRLELFLGVKDLLDKPVSGFILRKFNYDGKSYYNVFLDKRKITLYLEYDGELVLVNKPYNLKISYKNIKLPLSKECFVVSLEN